MRNPKSETSITAVIETLKRWRTGLTLWNAFYETAESMSLNIWLQLPTAYSLMYLLPDVLETHDICQNVLRCLRTRVIQNGDLKNSVPIPDDSKMLMLYKRERRTDSREWEIQGHTHLPFENEIYEDIFELHKILAK